MLQRFMTAGGLAWFPRFALVGAVIFSAVLGGCTPLGRYARDRAMDLTDVIDIKYGTALGVGVKLQATGWYRLGLGLAETPYVREWFGRMSYEHGEAGTPSDGFFMYFLLGGAESPSVVGEWLHGASMNFFGFEAATITADDWGWPGPLQRWRFGGEVLLLGRFGVYLNLGELADFLLGFGGMDIAHDDGVPKSRVGNRPPRREEDEGDGEAPSPRIESLAAIRAAE